MKPAGSLLLVCIALVACSPETATTTTLGPTTSLAPPTTSTQETSTSAAPTTTGTLPPEATVTVLLAPFSEMGPGWTEVFFPYGEDEEHLGTSIGGDGGLRFGPENGSQGPDGTWWFFDAANLRLAHFAEDATYLDQVLMPSDLLSQGIYFQYQMPQVLDDGSLAGFGYRGEDSSAILRLIDGDVSSFMVESDVAWVLTDGTGLYGLSFADGLPYRLDLGDQTVEQVEWFRARDGSRFMVRVDNSANQVVVELPDVGVTRTLLMRFSEDPEVAAFSAVEVETGVDGTLYLLFYGAPESDERLGIGGLLTITADGGVSEMEPIADPFSSADPGSPAHLGVRPGTSDPWLMAIHEDGVRIFTR
jgi:hypothetical protein